MSTNWFNDPLYIPETLTKLSESQAANALNEAWKRIYNKYPKKESLALLWSQTALETGRWKIMRNGNWGNIKRSPIRDKDHKFTMFRVNEILNGVVKWFDPPHIQTHFKAYDNVIDGAEDYIKFVSQRTKYKKAWEQVIKGDPKEYSHQLKLAGYYTASESLYTKGVVRLTQEFLSKADNLLKGYTIDDRDNSSLFSEEEKKELQILINLTNQNSIDEYFSNSNNFITKTYDDTVIKKVSLWDKIKKIF